MTSTPTAVREETLGQLLRRERTKKGIFLSEVSEKTCVRTYYLESIEEGNFHKLPPTLIARGFVRAYADYIGVDPNAAAEMFNLEAGVTPDTPSQEESIDLSTSEVVGGLIHRLGGAFFWFIPRKKKFPTIDLGDFINQMDGSPNKERVEPSNKTDKQS